MAKFILISLFIFPVLSFAKEKTGCGSSKCYQGDTVCNGEKKYEMRCRTGWSKFTCRLILNGEEVLKKQYPKPSRKELREKRKADLASGKSSGGGDSLRLLRAGANRKLFQEFKSLANIEFLKCATGSKSCIRLFSRQAGPENPSLRILKSVFSKERITSNVIEKARENNKNDQFSEIRNYDLGERRSSITLREWISGEKVDRTYEIKRDAGYVTDVTIRDTKNDRKFELKFVGDQCFPWSDSKWPDSHLAQCADKSKDCSDDEDWQKYQMLTKKPVRNTARPGQEGNL